MKINLATIFRIAKALAPVAIAVAPAVKAALHKSIVQVPIKKL